MGGRAFALCADLLAIMPGATHDTKKRAHVIGGTCRVSTENMQMLLAAALAGAGVAYAPTIAFGEKLAHGQLAALLSVCHASGLTIQSLYPVRHVSLKVRQSTYHPVDAFNEFGRPSLAVAEACHASRTGSI